MTLYVLGTPESLPASLRDEEGNVYPVQPMTGAPIPGGATQSTFLFQPGGVAGGNVFTSWLALYAALNLAAPASANGTRPPTTIGIDTSFATATIPAGAYNLDGVSFEAVSSGHLLTIADGATITAAILRSRQVSITYNSAAVCITWAAGQGWFYLDNCTVKATGAGALINVTGGTYFMLAGTNSVVGDGAHATLSAAAGGTAILGAFGGTQAAAAVIALAGGAGEVAWDTLVPGAQAGGVTVAQIGQGYVPTTPGNWNPAPATMQAALDTLAAVAKNHVQGIQAFGAAAAAITTANLAHTTVTGHTRCFVSCSVSSAAAGDDIGFQLNLDGVPTGPVMGASSAIIGAAVSVAIQYDFGPAAGAHHYSITATSGSAANLTGIQAIVQVQELLS